MLDHLIISLVLGLLINTLVFLVAYRNQSDAFTDLAYCSTFVLILAYLILINGTISSIGILTVSLISIWAFRLGIFLFKRIKQMGKDKRFEKIRTNFWRFFRFFFLQGFGAWVISLPAIFILLSDEGKELLILENQFIVIGGLIALIGLIIEVVADHQKFKFKSISGNQLVLYKDGLYRFVQYPSYSGEILFWTGIFIVSIPVLEGYSWLSIISPVFITFLLLFVSGIPYVERDRKKLYGDDPEYLTYNTSTKKLIPYVF